MRSYQVAAGVLLVVAVGVTACQLKSLADRSAPTGSGTLTSGSAAAALAKLAVRPDGSMSTYNRVKNFGPAWRGNTGAPGGRDHRDTRDNVLSRDLTGVRRNGRCTLISGTLANPYTGKTIRFKRGRATSSAVRIDHLIPLGNVG